MAIPRTIAWPLSNGGAAPNALREHIEQRLMRGERVVAAVDGPCASGKSTLAALLADKFACPVVHMDDFFLPEALRTDARLAEVGGNIHYERFAEEVLPGLLSGEAFHYRRFDCQSGEYAEWLEVPKSPLVICEGSYSLHPCLAQVYNLKIFVACETEVQRGRLKRRSPMLFERFVNEWVPMENAYFAAYHIADGCDFLVKT